MGEVADGRLVELVRRYLGCVEAESAANAAAAEAEKATREAENALLDSLPRRGCVVVDGVCFFRRGDEVESIRVVGQDERGA